MITTITTNITSNCRVPRITKQMLHIELEQMFQGAYLYWNFKLFQFEKNLNSDFSLVQYIEAYVDEGLDFYSFDVTCISIHTMLEWWRYPFLGGMFQGKSTCLPPERKLTFGHHGTHTGIGLMVIRLWTVAPTPAHFVESLGNTDVFVNILPIFFIV